MKNPLVHSCRGWQPQPGRLLINAIQRARILVQPFLCLLVASCIGLMPEAVDAAVAGPTIAVDLPCVQVFCPPDQTIYTCNDLVTPRTYPIEIVQKCAGAVVPVSVTCEPPPGTPLGVGAHVINCVFRVNQEIVGKCSFIITVVMDTEPPKITCPPDLTVIGCPDATGSCGAVVNYPPPTATDNSGSASVICVPPSGSAFPCGTTLVTCSAIDRCQNISRCSFKLVVVAGKAPIIQCPANQIIVTCDEKAVLQYPPPVVDPTGARVVCLPPPGTIIPLGTTLVTCFASNACGVVRCEFTVTVRQKPAPTIQCPSSTQLAPLVVACNSNCVPVKYPLPNVLNGTLESCKPSLGECLPPGNHLITCTATNECGRSSCEFIVRIVKEQGEPPIIRCPQDITVTTCDPCIPVLYPDVGVVNGTLVFCEPKSGTCFKPGAHVVTCLATNLCGAARCQFNVVVKSTPPVEIRCREDIVVVTCDPCAKVEFPIAVSNGALVSCDPPSGFCFKPGTNLVTCVATNSCSKDVCRFQVIVREVPPASIRCPKDIIVTTCDPCAKVEYPALDVENGTLARCEPPSGFCFKPGTNTVICVATNRCGDAVRCDFNVIVRKGNPPVIRCPQDILVTTCEPCINVTYPAPVVVDGALAFCNPPPGSCFKPGVNIVTCVASNQCARTECKFTVVVRDVSGEPIKIACPDNIKIETCDSCAKVTYPAPVVVNGTLASCSPASGSCLPPGLHVVRCVATNRCGQVAECKFLVSVRRTGPPVIKCPDDLVLETCGDCAELKFPAPGISQGTLAGCSPKPGTCLKIGTHVVTCLATNDCGATRCQFTVTVRKQKPIDIKCPRDIVIQACGEGEIVHYPRPTILGSDDVHAYDLTCEPPPGSFFPVGTNKVVCCVFDRCSQRRICCSFNIVVVPGQPCVKPPSQMVLWLPFDEPAALLANNVIPGAPDGLHINGPVPFIGQKVLNSLCFDGVNDFVAVPNYAAIVLDNLNFSIDAWILPREQHGRRVIVSKVGPGAPGANSPRGYEFYLDNGVLNLWLGGPTASNYNSGVVVPNDNAWHHVAVVARRTAGGSVRFYLDGNQVSVHIGALVVPIGNASRLHVGATSRPVPSSFFRGYIDEVEVFDRFLDPAEIYGLWKADRGGKCKIKCNMPWDINYPADGGPIHTVVTLCNYSGVDQQLTYSLAGPFLTSGPGTLILPEGGCTNIPVTLGRPTDGGSVGAHKLWTLTIHPSYGCPQVCTGAVMNPGPITATAPVDVVEVPGTNRPVVVPVGLDQLPPGEPVRLRVVGPDMQPDMEFVSLNGLPPGQPWVIDRTLSLAADGLDLGVPIRFVKTDAIGTFTILIEVDVDGDGEFNTLRSFDLSNPVIAPATLQIINTPNGSQVSWNDDGTGVLESSNSLDGPWTSIPGARSGYLLKAGEKQSFFRVTVPTAE